MDRESLCHEIPNGICLFQTNLSQLHLGSVLKPTVHSNRYYGLLAAKLKSKHPTNNWGKRKEKETKTTNETHALVLITKNTCCLHFARQDKKSDPLWMLFESHKVALSFEHIIGA